jgi:glycogen operon protein
VTWSLRPERSRVSLNQLLRGANLAWHGVRLGEPDWSPASHSLVLGAEIRREKLLLHLIMNAYWEELDFELPQVDNSNQEYWRRWIDTSLPSPNDIVDWRSSPAVRGQHYRVPERSVVVLFRSLGKQ